MHSEGTHYLFPKSYHSPLLDALDLCKFNQLCGPMESLNFIQDNMLRVPTFDIVMGNSC